MSLRGPGGSWVGAKNIGNMDGPGGSYYGPDLDEDILFQDSNFHHIAITRDSNNDIRFFIDGVSQKMGSTNPAPRTWSVSNTIDMESLFIGEGVDDTHIDDFRIVKGCAVWTANFTPPTAPHDPDEPSGCGGG